MSDSLWFNIYVTVHEGQVEEFKRVASELISVNEKRPEILSYEWFSLSEDAREFQILEIFDSADSVITGSDQSDETDQSDYHRLHEELNQLYVMTKVELLGNVSDAVRESYDTLKERMEVVYYDHFNGFTR